MQHTLLTDVCTCKGYLLHTRLHGLKNITAQQMLITAQQMHTHGMPQLLVGVSVECGYALYLGPECKKMFLLMKVNPNLCNLSSNSTAKADHQLYRSCGNFG